MKTALRKTALAARNALPAEQRTAKSRRMAAHLLQNQAYKQTGRIFSYVSMGSEAETREILEQAWRDGKTVAVPKTGKNREMVFLEIDSFADLREGHFGVMEPVDGTELIPEEGDLFLVPGALFDRKKNRLGYGGGYYDTYFEKYRGYRKIGLAFGMQISAEDLPAEETDVPLDAIVTENGWEE